MSLSKVWTNVKIQSLLRVLVDEIAPDKVQNLSLVDFINLATQDVAEMLSQASQPDYGTSLTVSDAASSVTATIVTTASYTESTRTIEKTAHSLTVSDVGKRITYWNGTTNVVIAEIESITDADNFIVTKAMGGDVSSTISYGVLSAHSAANISISGFQLDKVIKISDATNGLMSSKSDFSFENLSGIDQYKNSLFYNHFGETLFLFKGSSISSYGTLTLYYYRQPILVSADGDYIDVKDKYIPLVVAKTKNMIYEQLNKLAPEALTSLIDSKTAQIRQLNVEENKAIKERAKGLK